HARTVAVTMTARQDEPCRRTLVQDQSGSSKKLSYPLSLDEAASEKDQRYASAVALSNRLTSTAGVFDPVADHAYPITHVGAVFDKQTALTARECHNQICRGDKVGLGLPLTEAFRRPLPQLIFRTIERMNRVYDAESRAIA